MKISIIKACSDLGVHVNGSEYGPLALKKVDSLVDNIIIVKKDDKKKKERNIDNKKKNIEALNNFNEKLYQAILQERDNFIVTIGGDHSIAIASALASKKTNKNIGIIWIDSHADFHNFSTTISGNIHGMPFATICEKNGKELSYFFDGEYFNPENAVLVGARDIEDPEYKNLSDAGVKIFTTSDIQEKGTLFVIEEAIKIALKNTNGIHISYDLDVIDPSIAPGVSIKAKKGITEKEAFQILDTLLKYKENIVSFDLVEFNPKLDINSKTLIIAEKILEKVTSTIKKI